MREEEEQKQSAKATVVPLSLLTLLSYYIQHLFYPLTAPCPDFTTYNKADTIYGSYNISFNDKLL
ncbi:unnamed protein product [Arabidopsis lyrata]|uniref:Predicted protein n=1 Tax=Arabidopsis lyrata subsp. lyrata TaxID=81972 RepID=D7M3Q4_ARALL|nr:predicted protein [Arabidopsis lyrata subsp. lyrata]CAH8270781.1 unnamed protein product [Arabidopsis lyrata]